MARKDSPAAAGILGEEGWHPISDDGQRMITAEPFGYAIYSIDGAVDPKSDTREFVHRGVVREFDHAQQWLRDGKVRGPLIRIAVPLETRG